MRLVLDTDVVLSGLRSTVGASRVLLVSFDIQDYRPADPAAHGLDIPIRRPGDILRRLTWRPSATSLSGFRRP